jgi:hypothetical protein
MTNFPVPNTINSREYKELLAREQARLKQDFIAWNKAHGIGVTRVPLGDKIGEKYAQLAKTPGRFARLANFLSTNVRALIGRMKFQSSPAPAKKDGAKMPTTKWETKLTSCVVTHPETGVKSLSVMAVAPYGEFITPAFIQATVEALQNEIVRRVADEVMDDVLKMVNMDAIVGALTIKVAESVAAKLAAVPPVKTPNPHDRYKELIRQKEKEERWNIAQRLGEGYFER